MLSENAAIAGANYVAQTLLLVGFGLMMLHYFRVYKRPYLRYWSYAAFCYALSACFGLLRVSGFSTEGLVITFTTLHLSFLYLSLSLLIIGTADVVRDRAPSIWSRRLMYIFSFSLGGIALLPLLSSGILSELLPFFRDTLTLLISGVVSLAVGILILSHAPASMGPRLIAVAFMLLGSKNIILVQFSLFSANLSLSPALWVIQGFFNILFIAMAAVGIIIWLLDSERHRSLMAVQKAEYLNTHDSLTGIENREELMSKMPVFIDSSRATGRHLTLFMIGINRFKAINDTLGIRGGDRALIEVSQRLQTLPVKPLAVARISGDVFVLLFDHLKRRSLIEDLGNVIQKWIQMPMHIDSKDVNLTSSIGVARYPQHGPHSESLLNKATIALANAKRSENPSMMFYLRGMDQNYIRLVDLEPELKTALSKDQFIIHVQPLYQSNIRQLCGFEALIRWQHPERGLLPPSEFLPFIEELGLASELDDWVLEHCARFIAEWRATGNEVLPVAVNLSARHFQQPELVEKLKSLFSRYKLKYSDIELEITENVAMTDVQAGLNVLQKLQEMGIKVSIDDFGTGYSSLAYLRRLPVSKIKIDRSFISELLRDGVDNSSNNSIVSALIHLSHNLKKGVVAEGVETEEQFSLLAAMDCDQVQGFHLSPPVSLTAALELLQQHWKSWKASPVKLAPSPS
ncbi:putative bifunctional diguanylate cyclase/phosphodiesterase [Aliidiomarina minuta]|nr:bifunctional diguanylate cyclase/phosphodiesterase [Aliidiomarina minuta]